MKGDIQRVCSVGFGFGGTTYTTSAYYSIFGKDRLACTLIQTHSRMWKNSKKRHFVYIYVCET